MTSHLLVTTVVAARRSGVSPSPRHPCPALVKQILTNLVRHHKVGSCFPLAGEGPSLTVSSCIYMKLATCCAVFSRSWRDLFLDKNAPPIVAVEREAGNDAGGDEEEEEEDEEEEEEEAAVESVSQEVECQVRCRRLIE